MADQKLQVNVDFTKYPDLYAALEERVNELDTDRSKFIRQLVKKELTGQDKSPTKPIKKNAKAEAVAA